MTKLIGDAKVVRLLPLENKGREIIATITARGITYRAKGTRTDLAFVDHEVAIAAGQKVAARENGVNV